MKGVSAAITVSVTQDDINDGINTFMKNPVALALARELSMDGVFVSRAQPIALEMQPPYRTIYLPREAEAWLNQYDTQGSVHPCTFEVNLDDAIATCSTRKFFPEAEH